MTSRRLTLYFHSLPRSSERISAGELTCDYQLDDSTWQRGSLQQASDSARHQHKEPEGINQNSANAIQVTIYLPSTAILSTAVNAPRKQHKHLAKILPFLCEDQLTLELEQLHLVAGKVRGEQISVSAIEKQLLNDILQLLHACELTAYALYSEMDLLRNLLKDNQSLFWIDSNQCLVIVDQQAVALDIEQMPFALSLVQGQTAESLLFFHHSNERPAEIQLVLEELKARGTEIIEYRLAGHNANLIEQLTSLNLLSEAANIEGDLLCGEFAPRQPLSHQTAWKPAAIAACITLGICLSYLLISGSYFYQQSNSLHLQSEKIYRQYFPNDKRLVNMRTQAQAHLNSSSSSAESGFLQLLNQFKTHWNKSSQQLTLKSLRFNQLRNELILDIESLTIEQLDQLQMNLGDQAELLSANEDKGGVRGRIRLQGRG